MPGTDSDLSGPSAWSSITTGCLLCCQGLPLFPSPCLAQMLHLDERGARNWA